MKMINKTLLLRAQQDLQEQQVRVTRMCDISEIEYNNYQYNLGCAVLRAHVISDDYIFKLERDRMYWNWFKNEWRIREALVIRFLEQTENLSFENYKSRMNQMIESRKTYLSLKSFFTIYNKK